MDSIRPIFEEKAHRSPLLGVIALVKKQIQEVLTGTLQKETVKVTVTNDRDYTPRFSVLGKQLERLYSALDPIGLLLKRQHEGMKFAVKTDIEETARQIVKKLDEVQTAVTNSKYVPATQHPLEQSIALLQAELTQNLNELEAAVTATKYVAPETIKVQGKVEVSNYPQFPTKDVLGALRAVEVAIKAIKIPSPSEQVKIPAFPTQMTVVGQDKVLEAIIALREEIMLLPGKFPQSPEFPSEVSVNNFPVQKYPLPPTNININPLRGFVKSNAVTVTTALTPLPGEVLSYRRSLVVYNNSSNTIYIGGADVTPANGLPIVTNSYSPAFDAGPKMIVYAVTASSTADVRVIELSNDNIGG